MPYSLRSQRGNVVVMDNDSVFTCRTVDHNPSQSALAHAILNNATAPISAFKGWLKDEYVGAHTETASAAEMRVGGRR